MYASPPHHYPSQSIAQNSYKTLLISLSSIHPPTYVESIEFTAKFAHFQSMGIVSGCIHLTKWTISSAKHSFWIAYQGPIQITQSWANSKRLWSNKDRWPGNHYLQMAAFSSSILSFMLVVTGITRAKETNRTNTQEAGGDKVGAFGSTLRCQSWGRGECL